MKHAVYRWIIDYEKEEKWLNRMAAKGLHFIDFSLPGRYLFEEGTPGEYIYRLELLENLPGHPESKAYIHFIEETGAEAVSTYLRWVWFRKKAADGPFELYTDYTSRIKHYKRLVWFLGPLGLFNLVIGFSNLLLGLLIAGPEYHFQLNSIISPINLSIGLVCSIIVAKYIRVIHKLKKESKVRE